MPTSCPFAQRRLALPLALRLLPATLHRKLREGPGSAPRPRRAVRPEGPAVPALQEAALLPPLQGGEEGRARPEADGEQNPHHSSFSMSVPPCGGLAHPYEFHYAGR